MSSTESVPLLRPRQDSTPTLAALLGRATGRRGPSVLVRETAARQLEERRAEWGYSAPVVALDVTWNLAFVAASLAVLLSSLKEEPNVPIRVWICGYTAQCAVHVALVLIEYSRRRRERRGVGVGGDDAVDSSNLDSNESEEEEEAVVGAFGISSGSSAVKKCESVNTLVSFLWWIVGFYWIVSGGDMLLHSAPRLYWLAFVFLAFDVFFAIFCIVLACLIGVALCCCLPCIIAILYAVAGQEGASDADLRILLKYKFHISSNEEKEVVGAGRMVPVETTSVYLANERILLLEDAECCICLTAYEDGAELDALPCNHHFHSSCIVKWLKMNATCPLCKYDILKGSSQQV